MADFDESYVLELLRDVRPTEREAFYEECYPDIMQGYDAEVDEAWRRRSTGEA